MSEADSILGSQFQVDAVEDGAAAVAAANFKRYDIMYVPRLSSPSICKLTSSLVAQLDGCSSPFRLSLSSPLTAC